MELFAKIRLRKYLNEQANFQSFGTALLTLIRISTGESWNKIWMDMTEEYSITNQCDPNYGSHIY